MRQQARTEEHRDGECAEHEWNADQRELEEPEPTQSGTLRGI